MKKLIISFIFLWGINILNAQQNIVILSGTNISTAVNAVIVLQNCNVQNASNNASFTKCLLTETGNLNTTIGGTGKLDFKEITINKTGATIQMTGDLTIQEKLNFQSGNLDLNGKILYLAPLALFIGEKSSSRLIGPNGGFAAIDVIMNQPNLQNPGNLGLSVSSSANMGTVSILRGHEIQSQNGSPFSIKRHYAIESNNGPSFLGTLRLAYFDEELNGMNESLQQIWSSLDRITWVNRGYTNKNELLNFIESTAITNLEWFTMSNPTPGIVNDPELEFRDLTIKTDNKLMNLEAHLYPNPVNLTDQVWLALAVDRDTKGTIKIINPLGQIMKNFPFSAKTGNQKLALKTNDLWSGLYLVQIEFEEGTKKILKLQIQ